MSVYRYRQGGSPRITCTFPASRSLYRSVCRSLYRSLLTHNLLVARQQLRKELLDKLPPQLVRWGHRFLRYEEIDVRRVRRDTDGGGGVGAGAGEEEEGLVRIVFENEQGEEVCEEVDVVVAADGIYSAVMRTLLRGGGGERVVQRP